MNIREITIGRSKSSDIFLDNRCIYASNNHGSIYYDGNRMMYRDNSSNGTMIAGRYQLNWNQTNFFFVQRQPMPMDNGCQAPAPDSPVSHVCNYSRTIITR